VIENAIAAPEESPHENYSGDIILKKLHDGLRPVEAKMSINSKKVASSVRLR
jgi:hypothetical protein